MFSSTKGAPLAQWAHSAGTMQRSGGRHKTTFGGSGMPFAPPPMSFVNWPMHILLNVKASYNTGHMAPWQRIIECLQLIWGRPCSAPALRAHCTLLFRPSSP